MIFYVSEIFRHSLIGDNAKIPQEIQGNYYIFQISPLIIKHDCGWQCMPIIPALERLYGQRIISLRPA